MLAAAKLWRASIVIPCVALTATVLIGSNFKAMDQSGNHFVVEFGRQLLLARLPHAVILTQGDMVTNSIR